MKVIFTIDTLANSGAETSTLDIISNFSKDIEVKVIYFYPQHDLKSAYENKNIPLIYLDYPNRYSIIKGSQKLKNILENEKPDLVVSCLYRANIMSRIACKLSGILLMGTFVSDSYSNQRTAIFSLKKKIAFKFYYFIDRFTVNIPIGWIANSKYIKHSNAKHLKLREDKIAVIYRGRNSKLFPIKEFSISTNNFTFVSIGRLLETKGLLELVNAFYNVYQVNKNVRLLIYGEGSFRGELEQIIHQLNIADCVNLMGNEPNAYLKLSEANCFVFPSWYEGFSGALVEAMMTGIPIIASDIPMNLEAVENEKTALIHQVKDSHDIANKMKQMISDYDKMIEMGKRARKVAIEKFDIREIAVQYEKTLKRIVNENQKNS